MRGTDGFDSLVVEKIDGLGWSFGPIKFEVRWSAEAMGGGRLAFRLVNDK